MKIPIPAKAIVPILIGIILVPIPLLGSFHIESAILAAFIGCFWAGWIACEKQEKNDYREGLTISGYLYLAGTPLLVASLINGCFSIDGLGFWLLLPLPSVFLGYAIGRLLRIWDIRYRRFITVFALIFVAFGILIIDFYNYPQVYFFNHVWGAWPGPIYDEEVTFGSSVLFFRVITGLWIAVLWFVPDWNINHISRWIVILASVSLCFCYMNLANMDIISSPGYIQAVLGGKVSTPHFDIYYEETAYSESEINLIAEEHEFYLRQISRTLDTRLPDSSSKIASYLYGNPWQKKDLVGAKFTSYVPIWLSKDQLHIARQQIKGSLRHELVHIISKHFGNRLFNGSWSIGLIEGLAVAIDGGASSTTTIDQLVASEQPYPRPNELEQAFSFLGFYSGRSGVNYTTSGSFVQYLLQQYPIRDFKEAYRTGNIPEAYHKSWSQLADGWYQHLDTITTDSLDHQTATRIFGRRSLFEKTCPHTVSAFSHLWDEYSHRLAQRDTLRALQLLDRALVESDSMLWVKTEWAYRNLLSGKSSTVSQAVAATDTSVALQLLYADAFKNIGKNNEAKRHLSYAEEMLVPASGNREALRTRRNNNQWVIYRDLVYYHQLPDSVAFAQADYRTKIRSLHQAIEQNRWSKLKSYGRWLKHYPIRVRYFEDYVQLIHLLAFKKESKLAQKWLNSLQHYAQRPGFNEIIEQERYWTNYLINKYKMF